MAKVMTELAWAAGFFDGEGCTRVNETYNRSGTRYRCVVIQISQKDRRSLDRFQAAVGVGRVYLRAAGHHVFCIGKEADTHRALELMWPYLGEAKREQANDAIERAIGRVA